MTPLEAAKALSVVDAFVFIPGTSEFLELNQCFACGGLSEHRDDCPIPMIPQIVTALEAGEQLVEHLPSVVGALDTASAQRLGRLCEALLPSDVAPPPASFGDR
jgi:hypothetical protein